MFWTVRSPEEGVQWLSELLERGDDLPLELRAHAFRVLGSAGNPAGEDSLAEDAYEKSLDLFRQLNDRRGIATLLLRLGYAAIYRGDLATGRELVAESLELHRLNGNRRGESQALTLTGELLFAEGDSEEGLELLAHSAELAGEAGFSWWRARVLRTMVDCTLELGRPQDAEHWLAEALEHSQRLGDRRATMFTLARLARVGAEMGELKRAGLIWGADRGRGEPRNPWQLGAASRRPRRTGARSRRRTGVRERTPRRTPPFARRGGRVCAPARPMT